MTKYDTYLCTHCGRSFERRGKAHGDPHDTPLCPTCAKFLRLARFVGWLLQRASNLVYGAAGMVRG